MIYPLRKKHALFKIINNSLIDMPIPSNISIFWNFGSLMLLCLMTQTMTGIFLAMHYTPDLELAFSSVSHLCRDVNYGWLLRTLHANGASFSFLCLYLHIGRGIYYGSYMIISAWMIGVIILLLFMATAFLGYVLPWGQMSFWGATVITNLFSAIPYTGLILVEWIWGGFTVSGPTLNRFFSFHFILPFIIIAASMIHVLFLHEMGANNPLGIMNNLDKIPFHPYFTFKDIIGFLIMFTMLTLLTLFYPYLLSDPDNFIPANSLVTPTHIQPEWYFLFAYAILRSIPNKLGGVIALVFSVIIIMILPFTFFSNFRSMIFYPLNQVLFWCLISILMLLTWIGARPVETPYIITGQILTIMYFLYYMMNPLLIMYWDKLLK